MYVLRVCVGCAFCDLVLQLLIGSALPLRIRCRLVLVCSVWCVVWCVFCVLSVCGAAWHAEKPSVCRFKTSPCVRSKRHRVCRQHAHMLFQHVDVVPVHTVTEEGGGSLLSETCLDLHPSLPLSISFSRPCSLCLSSILLSLSLSLPSVVSLPSFSSFVLFLFSLPSSFSSLSSPFFSSLSVTMTMITRPVGSLCVHTALTCESVGRSACASVHSLFGEHVHITSKKQLS